MIRLRVALGAVERINDLRYQELQVLKSRVSELEVTISQDIQGQIDNLNAIVGTITLDLNELTQQQLDQRISDLESFDLAELNLEVAFQEVYNYLVFMPFAVKAQEIENSVPFQFWMI